MTVFEILKKIFCCGSSTVPPEEEPILPAVDSGHGIPSLDTYINIGYSGINTTVIEGLKVEVDGDADDDYSLGRTPPRSTGTNSAHSSPGFSLGVNTPTHSRPPHRHTPSSPAFFDGEPPQSLAGVTPKKQSTGTNSEYSSPGFSLGVHTPSHSSTRSVGSTHSSPGFSLGLTDDDDDEDTVTPQLVL